MATNTKNYNLKKPSQEDFYNIEDQNANMDIIDAQLKSEEEGLANHNHDGRYETPAGSQAKASAAQAAAKDYTDQKAGSIETELSTHLSDNVKHITSAERTAWNGKQVVLSDTDILNKLKNVDGAGSGLDADLLDGRNATDFGHSGINSSDANTIIQSGMYRLSGNANIPGSTSYGQLLVIHGGADTITQIATDYASGNIFWRSGNPTSVGGAGVWGAWRAIWHEGNDGSGSSLDADLLDGNHAAAFATAAQGVLATNAMPNTYGSINSIASSYTLQVGVANQVLYTSNASAITVNIPANVFLTGTQITFIQRAAGTVTFAPASGVILESKDTKRTIDGLFASATLIYLGSNTWSLIGALA